ATGRHRSVGRRLGFWRPHSYFSISGSGCEGRATTPPSLSPSSLYHIPFCFFAISFHLSLDSFLRTLSHQNEKHFATNLTRQMANRSIDFSKLFSSILIPETDHLDHLDHRSFEVFI